MPAWWGTRQSVSPRLRLEYDAMRASFGDTFKLNVPQMGAPIYWLGTIELNMAHVNPREHAIRIRCQQGKQEPKSHSKKFPRALVG